MDIKQLFSTFKRWLWLVVLGTIVGGSLGYYLSNRQTPIYQAQAKFVILPAAQTTNDYNSYMNNLNMISTYTQLLTSEDLLYEASNKLGFPVMKGQATATQVGDTKFVVLTVKDTDPFKAAMIANGLVDILIEQNVKLQTVQFESAERNLQARIDQAEEQIATLQGQITSLSTEILQKQIENVQAQMTDVQSQINAIKLDMS
ncbi:MAG TPA: Wzz/FepE/Etk N-terminal domain-containing protein, partial [Anaerolineaceae bacterium]|nr:Wzz/FepE/Etk N-terminal domain-containing protein [Anaerolineaceae bacterium]